jgi:6-phosphogluconate dehydrogenase
VKDIFRAIAARVDGEPCCAYIGADGAGHYVKMIHNGIEYADIQLIAEAYFLMKNVLSMSCGEMSEVFGRWNAGDLDSYLVQITADILSKTDPETGHPLVEMILDRAGQKGTGKWTVLSALDFGIAAPSIAEAVFARTLSAAKGERVEASRLIHGPRPKEVGDRRAFIDAIRDALYASKLCAYAQGFSLLAAAARERSWAIDFGTVAMIWRGGCIIRAKFLGRIKEAFERTPGLANLILDPYFRSIVEESQGNWRRVVAVAAENGIPIPAFSSSLSYFDSYRSDRLPANLIQAQRDYFGAHTYERVDRPGHHHTEWDRI